MILTFRRYSLLVIATLILVGINSSFSTNPFITCIKWCKVFEYILFFLLIYKTKPSIKIAVYCLMIAACYSSIIGLTQFLLQHTIGGPLWFLGERTFDNGTPGIAQVNWCWFSKHTCIELLRPYATFSHPNVLGGFLATTVPLFLWQFQKEKQHLLRSVIIGSILLGVATLFLTFSRSAWIVGITALYGALLLLPTKKPWVLRIGGFFALCGILFFLFPYIQTLTKESESVFIRMDLINAAVTLFTKHPLTGVGLGMFLPSLPDILNIRDLYFLQPVHNIYLLLISETGILGSIMFFTSAFYYIRTIKKQKQIAIIMLPSLALLCLGLVDHYPISVQQGQLLTVILLALPFFKSNS